MRRTKPPSIATWILRHLTLGNLNDALAGDLLEEFRAGRSSRWYWRQVLQAIAIAFVRDVFSHLDVLFFAALWSMLTPAWLLTIANIELRYHLNERCWQMVWPWSTVCDLGLLLAANLIFIWVGIALYLIPHLWIAGGLQFRRFGRGLFASIPVLIALWAALIVLPKFFLGGQLVEQHSVAPVSMFSINHPIPIAIQQVSPQEQWDVRYGEKVIDPYINPRNAIADLRLATMIVRLPFFFSILCTLWGVTSRLGNRSNRIAE
jgi:hypothetical protein